MFLPTKNIVHADSDTTESDLTVHNFTEQGLSSSFFSISGNLSKSKGTVLYNGLPLTQCLKIESSTKISFTTTDSTLLTLVFNKANSTNIKVDGKKYSLSNGILNITLNAGSHTIAKASVGNLYFMSLSYSNQEPTGTTTPVTTSPTTSPVVEANAIYASPNGSGNGTLNNPTSIKSAITSVAPGQTIYLLAGTYKSKEQLTIAYGNNGTASAYKKIRPYNNGEVIFDFSSQSYGDTGTNLRGIQLEGNYWSIYGIKVTGSADNGLFVAGKNNIIELCEFSGNRDSGLQISRRNSKITNFSDWPSNNLIKNCTSYNNMDPATGENADGFAAKLTCGNGNVFDGCIAYNNVDDGWNLYTKTETGAIGSVTIKNCIAFRNGSTSEGVYTQDSDGNGFKLGGANIAVSHLVENCISFENKNHGFTDNSNPGTITVKNCTSFNNSLADGNKSNFDFARSTSSHNIFKSLISFSTKSISSDKYKGIATNCSFQNGGKYYLITSTANVDTKTSGGYKGALNSTGVKTSDFVSLNSPALKTDIHKLWRNSDGSVNIGTFLRISSSSKYKGFGASY